jgi:hypothetical protein
MGVFILLLNLTVFSQVSVKNDTCYYQPPKTTCEQAQKNANAIVKYPVLLQSLEIKTEMIRVKENELMHVKAGFEDERKLKQIEITELDYQYKKEIRRKKRWRFATGFLAIVAGAFYVK